MNAQPTHTDRRRRIDLDLTPSPSTGAVGTAAAMHAIYGLGDPEPRATTDADEYLKDFFGVSS